MLKGKLVVLSLFAVALLCWQIMPASVNSANSGIVDPCSSSASSPGGCWVVCPQGDGAPLNNLLPAGGDATITVTVKDQTGAAVAGVPAFDFWLLGWEDNIVLCGGSGSISATAATDLTGTTTITGQWTASGCDSVGVTVVVQGTVLLDPADWSTPLCLPILTVSPDADGNGQVLSGDFTIFGNAWHKTDGVDATYNRCVDYDCDGFIGSVDFTVFGNHAGPSVVGHKCL